MKARSGIPLALVLLALTGCGPIVAMETGMKEAPVDILLGLQHKPSPPTLSAPPLFQNLSPNFPTPLVAPPPVSSLRSGPVPTPPPVSCPVASPYAFVAMPATAVATHRPAAASYPYRYTGTITSNPGQPNAKTVKLPTSGTREIANVSALQSDGSYTYDVIETYNQVKTTTTFDVVPNPSAAGSLPGAPSQANNAGIYIRQIQSGSDNFTPTPEVMVMQFPAQGNTSFQGAGTDGANTTTMKVDTGTDQSRVRVNACGTLLDSWQVEIVGRILNPRGGPNMVRNFDITFASATQYGGFNVSEHVVESYQDPDGTFEMLDVTDTIDVPPRNPQAN